eukprot:4681210-Amphidinium_carterae.1
MWGHVAADMSVLLGHLSFLSPTARCNMASLHNWALFEAPRGLDVGESDLALLLPHCVCIAMLTQAVSYILSNLARRQQ